MATKIRLKRFGKKRLPIYRIVVVDERKKRDGEVIEEVGKYDPNQNPSFIETKSERILYWLGVGAVPTDAVQKIITLTGDYQTFKGEKNVKPAYVAPVKEKINLEEKLAKLDEEASKIRAEAELKEAEAKKNELKAAEEKSAENTEAPAENAEAPAEAPAEEKPAEEPAAE